MPSSISEAAQDIIKKLLVLQPEQRLGAGEENDSEMNGFEALKSHPFFDGTDWKNLQS